MESVIMEKEKHPSKRRNKTKSKKRMPNSESPEPISDSTVSPRSEEPKMTSLESMKLELEKMQNEDDRKERLAKEKYKRDFKKEREKLEKERIAKGIQFNPDIKNIKSAIKDIMKEERVLMLQRQIDELDREETLVQMEIDKKYGLLFSKDRRQDLTALADKFFSLPGNSGLPEHVLRALTSEEISDLKLLFDMFDVKGKGFISITDLKKALGMLGFRAPKSVLAEMINEVGGGESKVHVSFVKFLDLVVICQGDGPDPYGEIKQAFDILDVNGRGYLTIEDLRQASVDCELNFSNKMLREMMQEADRSGNGKITVLDFMDIMLQTSKFKFAS